MNVFLRQSIMKFRDLEACAIFEHIYKQNCSLFVCTPNDLQNGDVESERYARVNSHELFKIT